MRIAIDIQACQSGSIGQRHGRQALALLRALLGRLDGHEVMLVANAVFSESIAPLRRALRDTQACTPSWHVFEAPSDVAGRHAGSAWRRAAAELARESFLAALQPDVVLVLDAAQGWMDDAVISVNQLHRLPTALVLWQGLPALESPQAGDGDAEGVARLGLDSAHGLWQQGIARMLAAAQCVLTWGGPAHQAAQAAGVSADRCRALTGGTDDAAQQTLAVLERLAARADSAPAPVPAPPSVPRRLRLAYVSPLPPAASGIADYSAELLPALAEHYDIELIVGQTEPLPQALTEGFTVRSPAWLHDNAGHYDRILYHFGNSPFHGHMVDLLRRHPGTVVLHDFYLGHLFGFAQHSGATPMALHRAMWHSHGYAALAMLREQGEAAALAAYPCNLELFTQAEGVIVHSGHSKSLAHRWYGQSLPCAINQVALAHASPPLQALPAARQQARAALGLDDDTLLVCSFGYVGAGKLSRELLQAWLASSLAENPQCRLVMVGGHQMQGGYRDELEAEVGRAQSAGVELTGYVDAQTYRQYLAAADVAVQLRADSRGETSRAVLDAMAHGVMLIVNAHGSAAELPADAVMMLADDCTVEQISEALETCHGDAGLRSRLAAAAATHVRSQHDPHTVAAHYRDAVEEGARVAAGSACGRARAVLHALAAATRSQRVWPSAIEASHLAAMLARNHPQPQNRNVPPDTSVLEARRTAPRFAHTVRGLMIVSHEQGAAVWGSVVRSDAMHQAYRDAGMQLDVVHAPDADELARRLAQARYDFVQLERPCRWPILREALGKQAPDGIPPMIVFSSHRNEVLVADADAVRSESGVAAQAAEAELARTADVVLAADDADAARLIVLRGSARNVHRFANGGALPDADETLSALVYREHLPQTPYGMIVSSGDDAAVTGFFTMLGPTLGYLPPDALLVVAGGLGQRLESDARYRRWLGVNGSRCRIIGRPDALGLAALRRHAHLVVLPRTSLPGDMGADIKTAEALLDGHPILATSAAMQGFEAAVDPGRVMVEDDPTRFRRRLVACLQRDGAPVAAGWRSPGVAAGFLNWHVSLCGVPAVVRRALAQRHVRGDAA